jgi:hypothetical protein
MPFIDHIAPEQQEELAVALEEAALRVRQSCPSRVEIDREDDVDPIDLGNGTSIPSLRSPLLRNFRIEW